MMTISQEIIWGKAHHVHGSSDGQVERVECRLPLHDGVVFIEGVRREVDCSGRWGNGHVQALTGNRVQCNLHILSIFF